MTSSTQILRAEALSIARHVLGISQGSIDPATGTYNGGLDSSWGTLFHEAIVPAIERGHKFITDKHKLDLLGYSKIFSDDFSKETFDSIAHNATIADGLSKLNWGRIIALFTFLNYTSADLTAKYRDANIKTLQEWLVEFLIREDISSWIAQQGGWASIGNVGNCTKDTTKGEETASWWLEMLKSFFSHRSSGANVTEREKIVEEREKAVAERERDMKKVNSQLEKIEEKVKDLDEKVGRNADLLLLGGRRLENQISGIADHQYSVLKRTYDRDKEVDERFDSIDGTLAETTQQNRTEHDKTREKVAAQHRKTRKQGHEIKMGVENIETQISNTPRPVEDIDGDAPDYFN